MTSQLSKKHERLLERLYNRTTSSSCFTSTAPLLKEALKHDSSVTRKAVEEFLARHATYTLHRRVVRKFRRLPTIAAGMHVDWQADLAVFQDVADANAGYNYLLVCIDVLSRQINVAPVKTKKSDDMIKAFEQIFKRAGTRPHRLFTDQGTEFTARPVQAFLKSHEIRHYSLNVAHLSLWNG